MKNTIQTFLFLVLSVGIAFGPIRVTAQKPVPHVNIYGVENSAPINLSGPIYLQDSWSYGTLYLRNGQVADSAKLRFNILTGDLVFYHERFKKYYVADRNTFDSFILNKARSSFFEKYSGRNIGQKVQTGDLVEVLYQNKAKLVVKHTAIVSERSGSYEKDLIVPRKYYVLQFAGIDTEVRLTPRSLFSVFPDRKKEIRKTAARIRPATDPLPGFVALLENLGI
ncbi:MAG TPA: hypothetical protein PLK12_05690 [Prolixibacteraceae bacterium]|nr:hypothetical protein [Prolixibacteraceae bacterium]